MDFRPRWLAIISCVALVYIFNTTKEDRQVAKVLSGWQPNERSWVPSLAPLEEVLPMARAFCKMAFRLDTTPDVPEFLFHSSLIDCFGATVIYHYPDMLRRARHAPYPRAVRSALAKIGLTENELVSWSLVLRQSWMDQKSQEEKVSPDVPTPMQCAVPSEEKSIKALLFEQVEMMRALVQQNSALAQRVEKLEQCIRLGQPNPPAQSQPDTESDNDGGAQGTLKRRRKGSAQDPRDAWFTWYASSPPLWENKKSMERRRYSEIRQMAAAMRLFAPECKLDRSSPSYSADVMRVGTTAEKAMLQYVSSNNCNAKSLGTILAFILKRYKMGALDEYRARFLARVRASTVVDPTPLRDLLPSTK
jgi:hypothetical protein